MGDIHYIDTGVNRLQIRDNCNPRQTIAKFSPQTKIFYTLGSVVTDKGVKPKSVEVVKSETDATSGLLQAPTVKTKEITPIAPETDVKIVNLISNKITPLPDNSFQVYEDAFSSKDLFVGAGGKLSVDKIGKVTPNGESIFINDKDISLGDVDAHQTQGGSLIRYRLPLGNPLVRVMEEAVP